MNLYYNEGPGLGLPNKNINLSSEDARSGVSSNGSGTSSSIASFLRFPAKKNLSKSKNVNDNLHGSLRNFNLSFLPSCIPEEVGFDDSDCASGGPGGQK